MRLVALAGILAAAASVPLGLALWAASRGVADAFLWANGVMLAVMAALAVHQAADRPGCPACLGPLEEQGFCGRCGHEPRPPGRQSPS